MEILMLPCSCPFRLAIILQLSTVTNLVVPLVVVIHPWNGLHKKLCRPHRKHHVIVVIYQPSCSNGLHVYQLLPSNDSLILLRCSGFQPLCHIAPSLRLLIWNSLQAYHHSFFSEVMGLWHLWLPSWTAPPCHALILLPLQCVVTRFLEPAVRPNN
jgi:hypothetical protein